MTARAELILVLERCRRRLHRVDLVRRAGPALAATIVLGEAAIVAAHPSGAALWSWVGWLLLAALAMAALILWRRAPSLRQTAAALDDRARLEDRCVTALECLDQPDVVAGLVVRDAAARAASVDPARLFRFEASVYTGRMAAVAGLASLIFAVVMMSRPDVPIEDVAGGQASASAGGPGIPGRGPRSGTAPRAGSALPVASANPGAARPAAPPSGTPAENARAAADARANPSTPAPPDPPRPAGSTSPSAQNPSRPSAGASSAGLGKERLGDLSGGAARSGEADGRVTIGSGGARGGAPTGLRRTAPVPVLPQNAGYAAAYQSAWKRAEAAIADQRVPASLREYVRRYFVAIRPGSQE